jgi:hypothetical protein
MTPLAKPENVKAIGGSRMLAMRGQTTKSINFSAYMLIINSQMRKQNHALHCRGVAVMKPENRVEFKTGEEAERAGYRRAGDCR